MGAGTRSYKYFDLLTAAFAASLFVAGTVASKLFAPVAGIGCRKPNALMGGRARGLNPLSTAVREPPDWGGA
jgi:hypothetical protein